MPAKLLGCHKESQVDIIKQNNNEVPKPLQIMSSLFKDFIYGEHLIIISPILGL